MIVSQKDEIISKLLSSALSTTTSVDNIYKKIAAAYQKYTSTIPISKNIKSKRNNTRTKNISPYLKLEAIQKILNKFLLEKQMSKENFAILLGISTDELNLFLTKKAPLELIVKINLPLIKLYCETKWP